MHDQVIKSGHNYRIMGYFRDFVIILILANLHLQKLIFLFLLLQGIHIAKVLVILYQKMYLLKLSIIRRSVCYDVKSVHLTVVFYKTANQIAPSIIDIRFNSNGDYFFIVRIMTVTIADRPIDIMKP